MSVLQINGADAFALLQEDENSVLVDVRTFEEFNFVGVVDASDFSERLILAPWKLTIAMKENPSFAEKLEASLNKLLGENAKTSKILFLCRTGGRSNAAANFMSELGYSNCFNIVGGFEGDLNELDQRGKGNGWKAEGLPWRQA